MNGCDFGSDIETTMLFQHSVVMNLNLSAYVTVRPKRVQNFEHGRERSCVTDIDGGQDGSRIDRSWYF